MGWIRLPCKIELAHDLGFYRIVDHPLAPNLLAELVHLTILQEA